MANLSNINNKFIVTSETEALIGATSWSGVGSGTLAAGLVISGNTSQFILDNPSYNHFTMYSASDSNIYNIFGSSGNYLIGTGNKDTSSWSQKFRIDSSGRVGIGITPSLADVKLHTYNNSTNAYNIFESSTRKWVFGQVGDVAQVAGVYGLHGGVQVDGATGDVGIGTDSPGARIDIKGVAGSPATSGTTQNGILRIQNATNNNTLDIGQVAGSPYGTWLQAADKSDLNPTYTYPILLNPLGGNVGIGTITPASSYGFTKTLEIQGAADAEINISQSNNSKHWSLGIVNGANYQQTTSGQQYIWIIGGSEKMRISNTGNVGIGENSPTLGKLQIRTSSAVAFSPTVFTSNANLRLQTGGTAAAGITTGISMGVGGSAEAYIGAVQNVSTYADIVFQTYHGAYGERMRINSIGNVGIGIASPAAKLDVLQETRISYLQGNQYRTRITNTDGNTRILSDGAQCNIIFGTTAAVTGGTASEKMRIDWRGNVGIGTTSPDSKLQVVAGNSQEQAWFGETGYTNAAVRIGGDNGGGGRLYIQYAGDSSYIDCYGGHGSTERYRDLGLYARNLKFFTTSGGSPSEAMHIDSSGNVTVNEGNLFLGITSSKTGTAYFWSNANDSRMSIGNTGSSFEIRSTYLSTAGYKPIEFYTSDLQRLKIDVDGSIFMLGLSGSATTGSDVRYSTATGELYYQTSSKRYKTDIINLESSLDKINTLRPVRYKDINTGEPVCGLIAEETVKVIPEVVFNKEIEGFDKPQIEGINYTDLVPFLVKSIQELTAKVEMLEKNCNCK